VAALNERIFGNLRLAIRVFRRRRDRDRRLDDTQPAGGNGPRLKIRMLVSYDTPIDEYGAAPRRNRYDSRLALRFPRLALRSGSRPGVRVNGCKHQAIFWKVAKPGGEIGTPGPQGPKAQTGPQASSGRACATGGPSRRAIALCGLVVGLVRRPPSLVLCAFPRHIPPVYSSLCATRTNQKIARATMHTRTIKQIANVSVDRSKTLPIAAVAYREGSTNET
jgi:hypothetical protein